MFLPFFIVDLFSILGYNQDVVYHSSKGGIKNEIS